MAVNKVATCQVSLETLSCRVLLYAYQTGQMGVRRAEPVWRMAIYRDKKYQCNFALTILKTLQILGMARGHISRAPNTATTPKCQDMFAPHKFVYRMHITPQPSSRLNRISLQPFFTAKRGNNIIKAFCNA